MQAEVYDIQTSTIHNNTWYVPHIGYPRRKINPPVGSK